MEPLQSARTFQLLIYQHDVTIRTHAVARLRSNPKLRLCCRICARTSLAWGLRCAKDKIGPKVRRALERFQVNLIKERLSFGLIAGGQPFLASCFPLLLFLLSLNTPLLHCPRVALRTVFPRCPTPRF